MKTFISRVVEREDLSPMDAEEAMRIVMGGEATPAQVGAYLVGLRMKGETVAEISGSARAMKSVVERVPINAVGEPLLDTCGTGGDGSHSFNISTASAFIIAGTGRRVAKHGNRAASSKCGSADVLAELGYNLDLTPREVGICIDEIGIGFMFAPKFHPAMKHAIGPRKELGLRTIFNILGPLTNPANASHQLIGVYDPNLTEKMANVLANLGLKGAMVVHGEGGFDELITHGNNKISQLVGDTVTTYQLDPRTLGFQASPVGDLKGGDPPANARRMRALLSNEENSGLRDVVLLNAAAGLALVHQDLDLGLREAREALQSGAALQKLESLIELSNQFS